MALNFVRQDDLSDEELAALTGKEGSVIVAEKYRNVIHGDEMLPKAAVSAVQDGIPFVFELDSFTRLRKRWEMGPVKSGSREQLPRSGDFCAYSPAFKQYVYRTNLIKRMQAALQTETDYRNAMGKEPVLKPAE